MLGRNGIVMHCAVQKKSEHTHTYLVNEDTGETIVSVVLQFERRPW